MNFTKAAVLIFLACLLGLTPACSSSSSSSTTTTTTTDASAGFPDDLAVASPTAQGSTSLLVGARLAPNFDRLYSAATVDGDESIAEKIAAWATIVAAADDTACQITLNALTNPTDPSCYGPQLDYTGHVDGSPTSGQLPTGDLGIWSSTEGADSEACVAAKINQLIQTSANYVDYSMLLAASMICLMNRASTELPSADGDVVTLTSELNTAVQVNNSSVTVSAATLTNLADVTDTDSTSREVYQFDITVQDTGGSDTLDMTFGMKHMPTATDNSTFKGKIWMEIDGLGGGGDKSAISLTYELASATDLRICYESADWQLFADGTDTLFTSTNDIDFTGGWDANARRACMNVDPSDGTGSFSYSWQAGSGDDKGRIFNGFTDATSGCGFFGYGDNFNTTTGEASDNVIDGFICNWAGPGNDHSMSSTSGIAQKQCMTLNTTTGIFEVNTSKDDIAYAPTVACVGDGTMQVRIPPSNPFENAVTSHELVTLSSDTDFANYTAPTAPDMPTDF